MYRYTARGPVLDCERDGISECDVMGGGYAGAIRDVYVYRGDLLGVASYWKYSKQTEGSAGGGRRKVIPEARCCVNTNRASWNGLAGLVVKSEGHLRCRVGIVKAGDADVQCVDAADAGRGVDFHRPGRDGQLGLLRRTAEAQREDDGSGGGAGLKRQAGLRAELGGGIAGGDGDGGGTFRARKKLNSRIVGDAGYRGLKFHGEGAGTVDL